MILVEGPDGAGKTSLVKQITAEFDEVTVLPKLVGSDFEGRDNLHANMIEQFKGPLADNPKNVLLDRHALVSEYIYSPCLGRPLAPGFNHPAIRGLRHQLLLRSITILCLPRYETVLHTVTRVGGGQPSEVQWNILGLYQGYKAFIITTPYPQLLWTYDYEKRGDLERVFDAVREHIA